MMRPGGRGPLDGRKLAGYGFVAGMVLAPFLALIYGWNAGLAVMSLALATTTYLAHDAWRHGQQEARQRLRGLTAVNATLTIFCVAVLVARLL